MKKCTICKTEKDFALFAKRKALKDGHASECKQCAANRTKEHRKREPEKFKAWMANWRLRNQDHIEEYRVRNLANSLKKLWKYRATKIKAIPKWDIKDELNDFVISEFYDLAKLRTESTNVSWHVDHIVPLQSKIVCGLHYYTNLRVITAKENQMKSNSYWEDMP